MDQASKRAGRARTALAVVGAAALLVTGLDAVTYAATGQSVILGKTNTANKPTTIKSTRGPALKLKTKKSKPPLAVNSKKRVKKLNADLLDGLSAETLDPAVTTFEAGVDGAASPGTGQLLFETTLPAGTYEMSFHGLFTHTGPDASYTLQCLAIDRLLIGAPPPVDSNRIYLAETSIENATDSFDPFFGQSNIVTLPATTTVLFGCTFSDDFTLQDSLDLHVRKVNTAAAAPAAPATVRAGRLARVFR
jgi:hypothetical protein